MAALPAAMQQYRPVKPNGYRSGTSAQELLGDMRALSVALEGANEQTLIRNHRAIEEARATARRLIDGLTWR